MPRARSRSLLASGAALALIVALHHFAARPRTVPVAVFDGCIFASPLLVASPRGERIVVATSRGAVAALDPVERQRDWQVHLPANWGEEPSLRATPVVVDRHLVVAYHTFSLADFRRTAHRVVVIDLERGEIDAAFPLLDLRAEKPASDGSGVVRFDPSTALSRAALVHGRAGTSSLGSVYVSFGGNQGVQPFHGWVFEIDLDAWRSGGVESAISAILLTTPEASCAPTSPPGTICGGGVWAPGGPAVHQTADSYELIVPTGDGRLDLSRNDYASALLRMGPGLRFDPGCDAALCAAHDPARPSLACLESCRNLFVPRLPADQPALRPASGRCDGKTFSECLAAMEWELGAGSPVRVDLRDGPAVLVQAGKDGAVYLVDAAHLGTLYDREQITPLCGDARFPCKLEWMGTIVARPEPVEVDGAPVVIVPTFVADRIHPAGVVALAIVVENGAPRFERFWQAPDPSSAEAVRDFRLPPSGIAISTGASGRRTAWIAEGFQLWGFEVDGGGIVDRVDLEVRSIRYARPLAHDGTLYLPVCVSDDGPSRLDAFALP